MPWGKYDGIDIKEIPSEYLIWCMNNITDRQASYYSNAQIKYYIQKELKRRNPKANNELYEKEK